MQNFAALMEAIVAAKPAARQGHLHAQGHAGQHDGPWRQGGRDRRQRAALGHRQLRLACFALGQGVGTRNTRTCQRKDLDGMARLGIIGRNE